MSKEQVLIFIGIVVAIVITIWLMGEFASFVIKKLTNRKRRKDKIKNSW